MGGRGASIEQNFIGAGTGLLIGGAGNSVQLDSFGLNLLDELYKFPTLSTTVHRDTGDCRNTCEEW